MSKSESTCYIEDCFRKVQLRKNIDANLRSIERVVKREFNIPIKISIINNKQNTFFGMCIYPSQDEINKITELILEKGSAYDMEKIYKEFITTAEKHVEIDSILLYDQNLNMSAGEVTAILLHELGHVVLSELMVERFKHMRLYIINNYAKKIINEGPIGKITKAVMSLAVAQAFSNQFNAEMMNEKKADNFAVKQGYGEELYDALNKLIINGKGSIVKKTEKDVDNDLSVTMNWAIENISQLQYRKDKLKRSLTLLTITSPSNFIKHMVGEIKEKIFAKSEKAPAFFNVTEAFILSKKVKPPIGAIDKRTKKVVKLQNRDLDIYRAELERVATTDDKIFLLERLYDLLDIAEYAKRMCIENPNMLLQSEKTIDSYIERLNDLIQKVGSKPISRKKFGLYIKYPDGYEG